MIQTWNIITTKYLGLGDLLHTEIGVNDIIAISPIACSRPSDSRAQCSDSGEQVKSYAEETRGEPHSFFSFLFFDRAVLFERLEQAKGVLLYLLLDTNLSLK